ncbi:MAG: hypothetical protein MJZ25_07980 [Fibrobacter sp.]|nr:hypothetical protein [Fibrobacter sp.]
MKKFLLIFAAAVLLMFTGCSRPRMSVDPEWTAAPSEVTVLVTIPEARNTDDVYDDFMGETEFEDWFINFTEAAFNKYSKSKVAVNYVKPEVFTMTDLPLGKHRIRFPLPDAEKLEGISGIVVSVTPVTYWRTTTTVYNGFGVTSSSTLDADLKYSIVSVEDQKVLAYGLAKDRSSFAFAMTKSNWEDLTVALVRKVLQKTPLQK